MKIKAVLFLVVFLTCFQYVLAECGECDGVQICGVDYCCGATVNKPDGCTSTYGDCICPTDFGDWAAAGCDDNFCYIEEEGCSDNYCYTNDDYDCCLKLTCSGFDNCWDNSGWNGDITDECCGDSPDEEFMRCQSILNPNPCDNPGITDYACCNSLTDCVYDGVCYNDGVRVKDIADGSFVGYCDNGIITLSPDGLPCAYGGECINYCVDTNYDGIFDDANDKCGSCNGLNGDICGAIASNGIVYGICDGASGFYECTDQTTEDENGFCVESDAACSKTDPAGGGYINGVHSGQPRNYIRCGSKGLCNGITSMSWFGGSENIGGGSCTDVDSTDVAPIYFYDSDDATVTVMSIADIARIEKYSTYNSFLDAPDWKWKFFCQLNDTVFPSEPMSDACNQIPTAYSREMTSVDPEFVAQGDLIYTASFFSPSCNDSYIRDYKVESVDLYTGYCVDNLWQTGFQGMNPEFSVVECEDDNDAVMVANFEHNDGCDAVGGCGSSYCNGNEVTACPTNLDFNDTCESSNAEECCEYYGYDWAEAGEENLVQNPGFENGDIDNWEIGEYYYKELSESRTGSASLGWYGEETEEYNTDSDPISVEPDADYGFGGYIYSEMDSVIIIIQVLDATTDEELESAEPIEGQTGDFVYVGSVFNSGSVTSVKIRISIIFEDGGPANIYFDDISMPLIGEYSDIITEECCGDDEGEFYVEALLGDPLGGRCCDNPGDIVWGGVCHNELSCVKEECDYTNPAGDCTGVCEGSSCYDGIDNDNDLTIDFCEEGMNCVVDVYDTDCMGVIHGNVYNKSSGLAIENALVRVVQRAPLEHLGGSYNYTYKAYTDENGLFSFIVNGDPGEGRAFDVVAGKEYFEPSTAIGIEIGYQETYTLNFNLVPSSSPCYADCTKGDGLCYAECDMWNGCYYYNPVTAGLCDGKQPGFKIPYSEEQIVECCEGEPYDKPKPSVEKGKKVVVKDRDFVRITKAVIMDGEAVNMIIDVFG